MPVTAEPAMTKVQRRKFLEISRSVRASMTAILGVLDEHFGELRFGGPTASSTYELRFGDGLIVTVELTARRDAEAGG